METTTLQVVSQETIKAQFNIALTQHSLNIQRLQSEADALIFDEENVNNIKSFINKVMKINDTVVDIHKEKKAPYWNTCKAYDAVKNGFLETTAPILNPVSRKFNFLCAEIADRERQQELAKQKRQEILAGIETNVIEFSNRIANCQTNDDLLAIERIINLQKTSSSAGKYGEFHQKAIDRYDEVLIPILKDQKEKVKEKERLEQERLAAEESNDAELINAIEEKQAVVEDEIKYNQVKVQEAALEQKPIEVTDFARTVFPSIKARRTTWEIELVDKKAALKSSPELLDISLNKDAAKIVLKTLKDSGLLEGTTEYIKNGIRYFEKVIY